MRYLPSSPRDLFPHSRPRKVSVRQKDHGTLTHHWCPAFQGMGWMASPFRLPHPPVSFSTEPHRRHTPHNHTRRDQKADDSPIQFPSLACITRLKSEKAHRLANVSLSPVIEWICTGKPVDRDGFGVKISNGWHVHVCIWLGG